MNPQPQDQQAPTPRSPEPATVTITARLRRLWRSGEQHPNRLGPDASLERRVETLEARTEHLKAVLDGFKMPSIAVSFSIPACMPTRRPGYVGAQSMAGRPT